VSDTTPEVRVMRFLSDRAEFGEDPIAVIYRLIAEGRDALAAENVDLNNAYDHMRSEALANRLEADTLAAENKRLREALKGCLRTLETVWGSKPDPMWRHVLDAARAALAEEGT
jgi:hypothetical protein